MLWQNAVTARSLEHAVEFDVRPYAGRIAPAPLLMITAGRDRIIPADMVRNFVNEVTGQKRLVDVPGVEHHDLYVPGRGLEEPMQATTDWFAKTL
jgi:fermentation-respiration switch protein FrsA (DUF1100 family)